MGEDSELYREVARATFLSELDKLEKGGYDDSYVLTNDDGEGRQTWEAIKAIKRSLEILGGIGSIKEREIKQRYRLMMHKFGTEDGLD